MITNEDMITNRTQADVDEAKEIREKYVKAFKTLTDDQVTSLERGMITINTLNRIEGKQAELKNLFNNMGYWCTITSQTNWSVNDVFKESDFQRIINNENILRYAFFTKSNTPATPNISYAYEDINSLEKILVDLDVMINDVKSNYRICGDFECGGE